MAFLTPRHHPASSAMLSMSLLLMLSLFRSSSSQPSSSLPFISTSGPSDQRLFTDTTGRVRIFRGMNFVQKEYPYYPTITQDQISKMVEAGMNVVRLGCMWNGHEPVRGSYNTTYLDELANLVEALASAGIYTLLDNHQVSCHLFCKEM